MPIPTITFASLPDRPAPVLAFGTGSVHKRTDSINATRTALELGFTFLDTAQVYETEACTGQAIDQSGVDKRQLWVLSKNLQFESVNFDLRVPVRNALAQLGLESLQSFLIHGPPRGQGGKMTNLEAWKQVETLRDEGLARVLGVSNFLAHDLQEILSAPDTKYPIEINQIEYHPLIWNDPKMVASIELMRQHNITPLLYGTLSPLVYKDQVKEDHLTPVLKAIATSHGWTEAEVLILWAQQKTKGIVITTSTFSTPAHRERMQRIMRLFEQGERLLQQEMDQIDEAGAKSTSVKTRCLGWW